MAISVTLEDSGKHASVFVFRCTLLESFLEILEDESIVADIKNDHNMIGLFIHHVLDPGEKPIINKHGESGDEIDIVIRRQRSEIKTGRNCSAISVPGLIERYFDDMVGAQGDKEAWWLVYFVQRSDAKAKIGETCIYYMTVIEVPTRTIEESDKRAIITEAVSLVQKVEKRIREEDDLDKAVLLPVDNIVPMDRLRKKLKKRDKTIKEKDKTLEEKDKALEEKDKALEEKDKALEEKDKALEEKDKIIEDQTKMIAKLKKTLDKQ